MPWFVLFDYSQNKSYHFKNTPIPLLISSRLVEIRGTVDWKSRLYTLRALDIPNYCGVLINAIVCNKMVRSNPAMVVVNEDVVSVNNHVYYMKGHVERVSGFFSGSDELFVSRYW